MSKATDKITAAFPQMEGKWTGESALHRSYATNLTLDQVTIDLFNSLPPEKVLKLLALNNVHLLFTGLVKQLDLGLEWFMTEEEFVKLAYYLMLRSLKHENPDMRGTRIMNKDTGNVFIPIGQRGECVAAIRYWAGDIETCSTDFTLGFRIRVEPLHQRRGSERERARELIDGCQLSEDTTLELKEVMDYIEMAEPLTDSESSVRIRIEI